MRRIRSLVTHPRFLLLAWAVALFVFCVTLHLRHHRFPFYYHPDEPGKVEQVITGKWNFHHPMLLLATARTAAKAVGGHLTAQTVVEIGRTVSASFMALAVVGFSLTAYLWRGWTPAIIAGVALALHHQLYELSHYLKEDSALLAGMSLAILAALYCAQGLSVWRALLLGLGCGLAISGKYLGVVTLGLAVPVLWQAEPAHRLRLLACFSAALVATLLLVNAPLVYDFIRAPASGTLHRSLSNEMDEVVHGQGKVTRRVPHPLYWNVFIDNSTPVVWLLLLAFYSRGRTRRSTPEQLAQRLLAAFPVAFTVALSFSPKENDRYFLPATAMFTLLAALGSQHLPSLGARLLGFFGVQRPDDLFTPRVRAVTIWTGAALLWTLQLTGWTSTKPGLLRYDNAFVQDDIADLEAWMRNSMPRDAQVVADSRAGLQEAGRYKKRKWVARASRVPQKLAIKKLAADKGTLEELRSAGVGYVIVSETSYGKFFRGDLHAKDERDVKYLQQKFFYETLLRENEPLFQRERGTVIYLHPGIRVYRL